MKLGIINGWSEENIKYVRDKGLECVEFCCNHNYDSAQFLAEAENIKSYCEKYSVSVASTGRWGMDKYDSSGALIEKSLDDDRNAIKACAVFGCPVFVTGVNAVEGKSFDENCKAAVDYLGGLIEFAKPYGIKIAVYNCDWSNFVFEQRAWEKVLGALPELGIKYDVSHCINRRADYLKELRDWGDRIYHFHLKGTLHIDGEGYDDPPAGLDDTKWGPVFSLLYTKGYNGAISIEPHSGKWQGALGQWGIDFTINFIRPYIMPDSYAQSINPYMP